MKTYYYLNNGVKIGPFTIEELAQLQLSLDTFIVCEGETEPKRIEDTPDVFEYLTTNAPSLPANFGHDVEDINKEEVIEGVEVSQTNDNQGESVRAKKHNFFSFYGRANRLSYNLIVWPCIFINRFANASVNMFSSTEEIVVMAIIGLATWFLVLLQAVKRCHDTGVSGFRVIIPFYILYLAFAKGDDSENEYGSKPKV